MPMYEYKCESCGTVNEFLLGVTAEDPAIVCGSCGGSELKKLISPISFSVKESSARFPIAGQCACGHEQGHGGCGADGCSCSA